MNTRPFATGMILLIMLFIDLAQGVQAQSAFFEDVTNRDGLYSNQFFYYVFQDNKGFVWVGSLDGLQRYDGYSFRNYDQVNGARYFMQDSRGWLWIGSGYGLYVMDPETEALAFFRVDELRPGIGNMIEDEDGTIWIAAQAGLIKLVARETEVELVRDRLFKKGVGEAFAVEIFRPDLADPYAAENQINKVFSDSRERLWIGGATGLFVFDRGRGVFTAVEGRNNGDNSVSGRSILNILEQDDEVIWVLTEQGLTRISGLSEAYPYDAENNLFMDYYPHGLNDGAFLLDDRQNFWIGSVTDGLVKMNLYEDSQASYEEVYTRLYTIGGIECSHVSSIMEDRTGLLWTGHQYPRIRRFREGLHPFTRMEELLGEYPEVRYDFNQVLEDDDGNLWVCTWGTGLFRISADGNIHRYDIPDHGMKDQMPNNALSVLEIERGMLWVSAYYPARIYQFDIRTGGFQLILSEPAIHGTPYYLYKIADQVLIGTDTGIWSYDLTEGRLKDHSAQAGSLTGLKGTAIIAGRLMESGTLYWCTDSLEILSYLFEPTGATFERQILEDSITQNIRTLFQMDPAGINIIHEDQAGNLWFQMHKERLLIRFDPRTGDAVTWDGSDGVTDNRIAAAIEDHQGNLWFVYDYGLSVLDKATGKIRTFNEYEGLPYMNQSRYAGIDKQGRLYFSGMGSFYRVDPANVFKNEVIPEVVITGFNLFNAPVEIDTSGDGILDRSISYTDEIHLKYNQHDISFTFAVLDYNDPAKNRYAYRLEGYQEDWIETGADNRIATFTNLSPGEYIFRVKGANNDGVWNEEGTFVRVIVRPPFWKTAWAYAVYVIMLLLLLSGIIYLRTKRLTKEKRILENQVAERTEKIEMQKGELMQQKEELQTTLENLKKTQDQLIESEKMAAVGGLVAGVAHEINTPVGISITAITNLQDEVERMAILFEQDEISRSDFMDFIQSSREVAALTRKNLERTATLVQSLKQVSVDQVTEQKRVFYLKEYLNDVLLSLKPKFAGKKITFVVECDEGLKLHSFPGVFAQIFTNLLVNSVQHGFFKMEKGSVRIVAEVKNHVLSILYSDDGIGIKSEDMPHIFEPFFTSDEHRGTGLGLHIVYNLIRQKLHGTIACESKPGHGVLFAITLPVK